MPTLHITRGFPAAGTTTWAEAFCGETGAVNINRDDIRRTLRIGQHGTRRQEDAVASVQYALFAAAVDNRSGIVLSDMNFRPKRFRPFLTGADRAGYTVEFHDFRVELGELLRRNAAHDIDRQVPESLIRDLWSRPPVPLADSRADHRDRPGDDRRILLPCRHPGTCRTVCSSTSTPQTSSWSSCPDATRSAGRRPPTGWPGTASSGMSSTCARPGISFPTGW